MESWGQNPQGAGLGRDGAGLAVGALQGFGCPETQSVVVSENAAPKQQTQGQNHIF